MRMINCKFGGLNEMANEIKFIAFDEISYGLRVVRYFVNRKIYKVLRESCEMRIPARDVSKNFGKGKLTRKPSVSDFFNSIKLVSDFLGLDDFETKTIGTLNSQGYHSLTVVECMNVLMRACDYTCMETLCLMIDENDSNEEARSIRKMLFNTRNNMITLKDKKVVIQNEKVSDEK